MSAIQKFKKFRKSRQYTVESFGDFMIHVEKVEHPDGSKGYRLKSLENADKISHRCLTLIQETWSCRDYIKKMLVERGKTWNEAGATVNPYIERTPAIQIISYLANDHKHAGVDASQKWAVGSLDPSTRKIIERLAKQFGDS